MCIFLTPYVHTHRFSYLLLTYILYFQPKIELPEYGSDDDCSPKPEANTLPSGFLSLDSGMEVLPSYPSSYSGNSVYKTFYCILKVDILLCKIILIIEFSRYMF